jgi:hypothetical protein
MSPNRLVVLLTPLVFAPLAGAVAAWLADHIPGYQVDQSALEEIFIAGALIALAPALQWLNGWQKHEARQADLERDLALADGGTAAAAPVTAPADPADLSDLDDLDELAEMDEFDADLLADDEEPALAGS